jgi:hypothetical protein
MALLTRLMGQHQRGTGGQGVIDEMATIGRDARHRHEYITAGQPPAVDFQSTWIRQ